MRRLIPNLFYYTLLLYGCYLVIFTCYTDGGLALMVLALFYKVDRLEDQLRKKEE